LTFNGKLIKEFFSETKLGEGIVLSFFIMCLQKDERSLRAGSVGHRLIVPPKVAVLE
jgi:hypothetical protein